MPNHLHVVLRLFDDLDRFVQRCKSYSANQCNRMLARSGAFWADDYFDVLIRNSRQLERVVTYVRNNPVKAELVGWRWTGMWPERYAQLT